MRWRERRCWAEGSVGENGGEIEEEKSHLLTVHFKYYCSLTGDILHHRGPAATRSLLPVLAGCCSVNAQENRAL